MIPSASVFCFQIRSCRNMEAPSSGHSFSTRTLVPVVPLLASPCFIHSLLALLCSFFKRLPWSPSTCQNPIWPINTFENCRRGIWIKNDNEILKTTNRFYLLYIIYIKSNYHKIKKKKKTRFRRLWQGVCLVYFFFYKLIFQDANVCLVQFKRF